MLKKILIVLAIILLVSVAAEVIQAWCLTCQICDGIGVQIGREKIGYTWVCTYKCYQGHIWQCTCF
jgi:hypothetical protein